MSKFMCASVIATLSLVATIASAAPVYDAFAGYNKTANDDTTLWSYRHEDPAQATGSRAAEPTLNASFQPHYASYNPWSPGPDLQGWNNPSGQWPGIVINDTGVDQLFFGVVQIPADTIYSSGIADGGGGASVLSFLVPTDGAYNIDFTMTHIHGEHAGDGEQFFIDHHSGIVGGVSSSQTLLAEGMTSPAAPVDIPPGTNPAGTASANLSSVPLLADDRINFVIDIRGGGASDSVVFSATVTMIPEPSSVVILAFGALACLWSGRRLGSVRR